MPTDIAVVRYRACWPLRSILVLVAREANSRRAARSAVSMARGEADGPVRVTLLHVLRPGSRSADEAPAGQVMDYALEELSYETVEPGLMEGADVVSTVLAEAAGTGP